MGEQVITGGVVVIYRRADGGWDWRLQANNGEIVATSGGQGYTERNDAIEAVARVFGATFSLEIENGFGHNGDDDEGSSQG